MGCSSHMGPILIGECGINVISIKNCYFISVLHNNYQYAVHIGLVIVGCEQHIPAVRDVCGCAAVAGHPAPWHLEHPSSHGQHGAQTKVLKAGINNLNVLSFEYSVMYLVITILSLSLAYSI